MGYQTSHFPDPIILVPGPFLAPSSLPFCQFVICILFLFLLLAATLGNLLPALSFSSSCTLPITLFPGVPIPPVPSPPVQPLNHQPFELLIKRLSDSLNTLTSTSQCFHQGHSLRVFSPGYPPGYSPGSSTL